MIFGQVGPGINCKCVKGGGAFVWPLIQDYEYLSLTPMRVDILLDNVLTRDNVQVTVSAVINIQIGAEEHLMMRAAENLLRQSQDDIKSKAVELIESPLRNVIGESTTSEMVQNRSAMIESMTKATEANLQKVGLCVLDLNVNSLKDEKGYLGSSH